MVWSTTMYQCKISKKSTHTFALRHVSVCGVIGVSPSYSYSYSCFSSYANCWVSVHAYTTSPQKTKWRGVHQRRWEENGFKFHSVTYYTYFIISIIHANTTKLCNITCTVVATGVILRSLECMRWNHLRRRDPPKGWSLHVRISSTTEAGAVVDPT